MPPIISEETCLELLNKTFGFNKSQCLLKRLRDEDSDNSKGGTCLANSREGRSKCGCPAKRDSQQHDTLVERLQRFASISTNQLEVFREELLFVDLSKLFCKAHHLKPTKKLLVNLLVQISKGHCPLASPAQRTIQHCVLTRFTSATFLTYTKYSQRTGATPSADKLRKRLKDLASQPFDLQIAEEPTGQIYAIVYGDRGQNDMVKIGHTTRSVESRMQEIRNDCQVDVKRAYRRKGVIFPRRVEALVHMLLDCIRYKMECKSCGITHNEFFRIKEDVDAKLSPIVDLWAQWIAQAPYKSGTLQNGRSRFFFDAKMRPSLNEVVEGVIAASGVCWSRATNTVSYPTIADVEASMLVHEGTSSDQHSAAWTENDDDAIDNLSSVLEAARINETTPKPTTPRNRQYLSPDSQSSPSKGSLLASTPLSLLRDSRRQSPSSILKSDMRRFRGTKPTKLLSPVPERTNAASTIADSDDDLTASSSYAKNKFLRVGDLRIRRRTFDFMSPRAQRGIAYMAERCRESAAKRRSFVEPSVYP